MESRLPFREIKHGSSGREEDLDFHGGIRNDTSMYERIERALRSIRSGPNADLVQNITVPGYRNLVDANDEGWWTARLPRLPAAEKPPNVLIRERTISFPSVVRDRLIERYCHEALKDTVRRNFIYDDCVARCYLGRRRRRARPSPLLRAFNLENYPLPLDQMQELALPTEEYARAMADLLAVLHWAVNVDAGGIELVLAPPRDDATDGVWENGVLGTHALWLRNFGRAREISVDEAGLEQAVGAFYRNDEYFPRPGGRADERLWALFKGRYLESAGRLVGGTAAGELPARLMERLEGAGEELAKKREALASRTRLYSCGFGH